MYFYFSGLTLIFFMQIKEVLLEVLVPLTREKCPDKSFSDFVTRAAGKIFRLSVAKKTCDFCRPFFHVIIPYQKVYATIILQSVTQLEYILPKFV